MFSLKEILMSTKFLDVQDGKIAYEEIGSGPLVICAPSLGDLRGEYRYLSRQLADEGYRVVSMDLRGLGESSVTWPDYSVSGVGSDLLSLIRGLNSGPAVIIGTSMAAGAAVWAAVEAPELVSGLVLIGPAVHGEITGFSRLFYSTLFARPWGPGLWLRYYKTLYPTQKPEDFAQYCAALRANLGEKGRIEVVRKMALASKAASEERLPRLNAPALVIMGSKDPDFKDPEAEARWLADKLHARHEMVKGAGHYPHAEMPEITSELVRPFLAQLAESKEGIHGA
jgi:pimeloyl-ACP methyl ester carboxylesterase